MLVFKFKILLFKDIKMKIKLNPKVFPFVPGSNYVDLWNIFYLTNNKEIAYGFSKYFTHLKCGELTPEGFIFNPSQTAEAFPVLLDLLAKEAAKLQNLDFGSDSNKIAQINYAREKYNLGLKGAKDLVETGSLPKPLKCWKLPTTKFFISNIPSSSEDRLVYVEHKGIFPLFNILQNKHLELILDWQPELSIKDVTPTTFYLYQSGNIKGTANEIVYSYGKYDNSIEINNSFSSELKNMIGAYLTLEEAKSHYAAFQLGVEVATTKIKERITEYTQEYTPKFY